ncbi:MAG: type II toxin-antitoxin system HicA family toxin [Treponema sp.]|nr:type II toxin-antitoxin system HicA family toxin [Treponema sp.]
MSRSEKLLKRILGNPKDFSFSELETLLTGLGYQLSNSGSTSGSAVRFINNKTDHIIRLHRPHPSPVLKEYVVKFIISELKQEGYLYD